MGFTSKALRASAKGQQCTLGLPLICNRDTETTVLAHLPSMVAGKATKSDDWHAVFACAACHEHMDNHKHMDSRKNFPVAAYQLQALQRTQRHWFDSGLLQIVDDKDAPVKRKTTKAVLAPKGLYK